MWKLLSTEHRTVSKPVTRAWLRWGLIPLLSAAVLLVLIVFARPKWRTMRLFNDSGRSVLIVAMPADWQHHSYEGISAITELSPPSPTGLFRWWSEHVLKVKASAWEHEEIAVIIHERPAPNQASGHSELEMVMRTLSADQRRQYRNVIMTRFTQSGMTGYDLEASSYTGNLQSDANERYVMLNSYNPTDHQSVMITVTMRLPRRNYSLLKPTMDEIIRRLRLVQK